MRREDQYHRDNTSPAVGGMKGEKCDGVFLLHHSAPSNGMRVANSTECNAKFGRQLEPVSNAGPREIIILLRIRGG